MQRTRQCKLHVAMIMDGNGRWAECRGLPRSAGHAAGVEALRRIAEAATGLGIGTLTVYAFSSDNWSRPRAEVAALLALLKRYLATEVDRLLEGGIRLSLIGRRDRLLDGIAPLVTQVEAATRDSRGLHLRMAFDYSARDSIVQAMIQTRGTPTRDLIERHLTGGDTCDVDFLIRTGGEQRLSDFLLWECAYAELFFTDRLWPDFTPIDLAEALSHFHRRERRFGGLNRSGLAV